VVGGGGRDPTVGDGEAVGPRSRVADWLGRRGGDRAKEADRGGRRHSSIREATKLVGRAC
jgi:hypothetical protein